MVKLTICPKCNKKGFYYRVAFGSWRCARCGYEEEAKDKTGTAEHIKVEEFWRNLSVQRKIEIYNKENSKNDRQI